LIETSSRLSGDAAHFKANWDSRRVPDINVNKEQTAASRQRLASIMAKETSQLLDQSHEAQRDEQKLSPDFYE
jgi:N-acyl homoserine lactone hydrolase